ncbi:MAG: tetratricopeptide repeat protein [bacterium]|nr:tetratricopeptide repeat protein [bacterium]
MKCPNCGSVLSLKNNRCDRCGEDVRMYKRVVKASNACYNQGLMKAKVRDLSGAVIALRKSLELDKNNTNARNLLGLVYYEMGETVKALREWVLSKHLQEADNDADEYISMVQSNPTKLENTNQAIKKYNQALLSAKQGNPDLSIIQLKKVVALNPKFIRAYQLLALLYMQAGEKDKASKQLLKAHAIDVNNTTTIRYMNELGVSAGKTIIKEVKEEHKALNDGKNGEFNVFAGMNDFKEDKPSIWPYLNLVIGLVVGVLVYAILIGPSVSNTKVKELNASNKTLHEKNASLESQLNLATTDRDNYKAQVEKLTGKVQEENATGTATPDPNATTDPNATADPNAAVTGDQAVDLLLKSADFVINNDDVSAAETLATVNEDAFTTDASKALYKTIKDESFDGAAEKLYQQGYTLYDKETKKSKSSDRNFDEAIAKLTAACALKDDYENAQYFLARAYMESGENDKARPILEKLVEDHPNTKRGIQAKSKLQQLPDTDSSEGSPSPSPSATPAA